MKAVEITHRRRESASAGVIILIILAVCLCILSVYQWTDQRRLISMVETERRSKLDLNTSIQEKEQTAKRYSEEITRLESDRKDLDAAVKTNKVEVGRLKAELKKAEFEVAKATNQAVAYKKAFDDANELIRQQNDAVKAQNESYKKMVEERNEFAAKVNKAIEEQNKSTTAYNELVDQIKNERAAAAAAQEKK
jgi:C4-dicarboxylate-specific signal transduction histidine kinase